MSHRNARLTPRSHLLLVERVRAHGMPVAHVAKAMGVSRQCAHRWVKRFDEERLAGLEDRSSRPRRCPNATGPKLVARARSPTAAVGGSMVEGRARSPNATSATPASTRWSTTIRPSLIRRPFPTSGGVTCAGFLLRGAQAFRAAGIDVIAEVTSDNAKSYT